MNSKPTILIVDDEPKNLQYLGTLLREMNYRVSFSLNGEEALKVLNEITPDLILLDINMPGMDGFEVCENIKSNPKHNRVPVIFLTSNTDSNSIIKGFKTGAADYVGKPFNEIELIARVETHLKIRHQTIQIIKHNSHLEGINQMMESELFQAAEYLKSQLPKKLEGKIETDWKYVPASHLGGDIFGYQWLDSNNFAIYLIDVSGHGVGAALMSMSALSMIKSQSLIDADYYDPASLLNSFNKKFKMDEHGDKYFTIWYGVVDIENRKIISSSAMHPHALLFNEQNKLVEKLGNNQIMIGAVEESNYENVQYNLPEKSKIFLFSDGTFELYDHKSDLLNDDIIINIVEASHVKEKSDIELIYKSICDINNNKKFDDDYTMIEIKL